MVFNGGKYKAQRKDFMTNIVHRELLLYLEKRLLEKGDISP